jgi:hypothetical protein
MSERHKRQIVRRIVLTIAAIVLLPVWYVGAWLVASRADRDGIINYNVGRKTRHFFTPLVSYCNEDRPGAELLIDIWWTINPPPRVFANSQMMVGVEVWCQFAPRRPDDYKSPYPPEEGEYGLVECFSAPAPETISD